MIPLSVVREYMPKLKDEDLKELGPVEYDQSKVPEVSKKHAENVRRKVYLPDMTESFARGVEYAGLIANGSDILSRATGERQDALEIYNNQVIREMTDKDVISAPEIIAAREGKYTLNERLASDRKRIELTPDDFEGTDIEKLQQAYDHALENKIYTIQLNRKYDITGGSIDLGTASFSYVQIIFFGGEIVKNDEGFIFTSSANNRSRNSPQFVGTIFRSTADNVYVYDGDKMIRHTHANCTYFKVGLVKSSDYIQTIRMTDCETGQLGCDFISGKMGYDIEVKGHKGEQTTSPYHFINLVSETNNGISYFGLRLQGLWEGYTNKVPFHLGTGYGLNIDKSYFEKNNGSIHITEGTGVGTIRTHGTIQNCVFSQNTSTNDIVVDSRIATDYLTLSDITVNNPSGKALINKRLTNYRNINNYATGAIFNKDTVRSYTKTNKTYEYSISNSTSSGIDYEVVIPTNDVNSIGNMEAMQYLVNIKGNFGANPNYRGHLTGILSIDTFNVDNVATSELSFTVLSSRSTDSSVNGSTTPAPEFSYYFKETGNKRILPSAQNPTIVFNLPNFKEHTRNTISIKGLENILHEYRENN